MESEDLTSLKDDMIAFLSGHGMRRFHGYVSEDQTSIMWDSADNPDGWKDFVEVAKASGAAFLTVSDVVLERDDLDFLVERLRNSFYSNDDDVEDARLLKAHVGKTGFVQLGWPFQGVMFVYEASTSWYDRYQHLVDIAEEWNGMPIDNLDQDDEH